jgi:hypothetical protein
MANLHKMLTDINSPKKASQKLKEQEYNLPGEKLVRKKEIKVTFKRGLPVYGCHQLSKALCVSLRDIGIPAKVIRLFPDNESKVIFRLNKKVYQASPFSTELKEIDPEEIRVRLKNKLFNIPNVRLRKMDKYTYKNFKDEQKTIT